MAVIRWTHEDANRLILEARGQARQRTMTPIAPVNPAMPTQGQSLMDKIRQAIGSKPKE